MSPLDSLTRTRRGLVAIFIIATALALGGCSTLQPSTPFPVASKAPDCVVWAPELLTNSLPGQSTPLPDTSYVLVSAESAAGLLVPVPFVAEAVAGVVAKRDASNYAAQIGVVDARPIVEDALRAYPWFQTSCANPKAPRLHPAVFMVEGHDGLYRLSLAFHVQAGRWSGRYYEHLPTALPQSALERASPEVRSRLAFELTQGAQALAGIVDRDMRGQLPAQGDTLTLGSLYLVGGRIAGLVSPEYLHYPGAQLLEVHGDELLVRMSGDMKADGQAGGLLFGLHHFRRGQLHHFQLQNQLQKVATP